MEHLKKINMSDREMSDAKNGITSRKEYGFRDPVVRNVVDKFITNFSYNWISKSVRLSFLNTIFGI